MKLLHYRNRKITNKEYKKYSIIIPPDLIERLNWDPGDYLEAEVKNGKLIIGEKNGDKQTDNNN